ncbi:hypothetical protein RUM43_013721 [Polyplax serrata]|uniref:Uncharacterized protein n=1 Tax=Polyplax serrata TaxID=468196 RepID=A0AAN8RZ18_POLSC
MSKTNGYNNPAYCHQYDSSMYEYQYVPEIDPDSPDLNETSRHQMKLTQIGSQRDFSTGSEFEGSDESNGSIIIEECNNRRVTLICEKRSQRDGRKTGATYYQDVSLESENGSDQQGHDTCRMTGEPMSKSLRHQRPLEPPVDTRHGRESTGFVRERYTSPSAGERIQQFQRPQRLHRYEEIPGDEGVTQNNSFVSTTVHRYAEISPDENGYPTLKKPIEIQTTQAKPRAITPTNFNHPSSFSPPSTPSRTCERNPYAKPLDFSPSQFKPNSPSHASFSSSPARTNSFEMAELSPPRLYEISRRPGREQTYFLSSPKRQPPVGASSGTELQDHYVLNGRCILPAHLQKQGKIRKERSHSVPNSPKRNREHAVGVKSPFDRKVMQIFHIKPVKSDKTKGKSVGRDVVRGGTRENPVRRNISNSFTDPPRQSTTAKPIEPMRMMTRSPYKPTTTEIQQQPKTAIITPIFQRKNQQQDEMLSLTPKNFTPQPQLNHTSTPRNFQTMSKTFQSTGNIFKTGKDQIYPTEMDYHIDITPVKTMSPTKLKRNQSVPNFAHTFTVENGVITRKGAEQYQRENQKHAANRTIQYSPRKQIDNLSPIDKSRLSLIDRSRSSWSYTDSEYSPRCSTCFILATIIHLITATATCGISFYLLSKMGRRYYLDFALIAGFINFTLGLLGFRSYCWRWLPNRNYVSGFIGLAAFSTFTCGGLSYLIVVKPMAGDPILDVMGGAICAVSVLTILLALTGLTMSGCCKAPPPDNRVTDL